MSRQSLYRLHPLLWATHAVISVAALNPEEIELVELIRPLLVTLLLALALQLILGAIFRSPTKGALLATLIVILFFSYGHVYDLVKGAALGSVVVGRHRYLLAAWSAAGLALAIVALHLSSDWRRGLSQFLSLAALVALVFPLSASALHALRVGPAQPWQRAEGGGLRYEGEGPPPDIYYIILDSYGRRDVMQDLYGFDNAHFERELRQRGFILAEKSIPNHVATGFSLASSLNMDYVTDLGISLPPGSYPGPLIDPIRDSAVRRELESLGYRTVATSSGWAATSLIDADVYLTPEQGLHPANEPTLLPPVNGFESLLLETTVLRAPLDLLQGRQTNALLQRLVAVSGSERHRRLVLTTFEHLEAIPSLEGPKFVFVHIVSPHRPYVFDAEGNPPVQSGPFTFEDTSPSSDPAQEFAEYREQLRYINQRVLEGIDAILAQSETDPIILLQSDTGPAFAFDWANPDPVNLELKASILNAFRMPASCAQDIYPTISPVNNFRLLFNCVFGGDMPLLPDQTLFTDHHSQDGYTFRAVNREDFTLGPPQ